MTEVNMLLAKYGIDNRKDITPGDIHKILKDFEKKGLVPTHPPTVEEMKYKRKDAVLLDEDILKRKGIIGKKGLNFRDYDELMARLEALDNQIRSQNERLFRYIVILDKAEKAIWTLYRIRLQIKKKKKDLLEKAPRIVNPKAPKKTDEGEEEPKELKAKREKSKESAKSRGSGKS